MTPEIHDAIINAMLDNPHHAEAIAAWAKEKGNLDGLETDKPADRKPGRRGFRLMFPKKGKR